MMYQRGTTMTYFRLFWLHLRVSVLNELQYRVNFFVQLFQSALALTTSLIALQLVFSYTTSLGGWSKPELLVIMGVHLIVGGIIKTLISPNMQRIIEDVQEGTLDYALTKPADSQVIVSVREFRIWQTIDIILGIAVITTAMIQLRETLSWLNGLGFVVAMFLGACMIYSVWLMLTTAAFWIVRADNFLEIFDSLYQAGRWPVGIYPTWLRGTLTFILPIAFAVTVPAEMLTRILSGQNLLLALGLAIGLMIMARLVWRWGLKNYTGASA